MASINDWKKKSAGTIKIDWSAVEENLGFKLAGSSGRISVTATLKITKIIPTA